MTIQKRLWVFFSMLFLLFSVGVVLALRMGSAHLLKLQKLEIQERKSSFEKVLQLSQQAIFVLAKDYSYWDELVDAIKNKDQQWAKVNIDSGIKTYQADGAWIYNLDFDLVYSVNKNGDERLAELDLNKEQVKQLFDQQALAHFFIATPAGFLELQGATVHASDDSEHKTPPQGYLFAGKLWDRDYLNTLSQLSSSAISLVSEQGVKGQFGAENHFFKNITDWQNQPLFTIVGSVRSEEIRMLRVYTQLFLKMFFLYTAIQMLVLLYFLRRFFKEPRKKIN